MYISKEIIFPLLIGWLAGYFLTVTAQIIIILICGLVLRFIHGQYFFFALWYMLVGVVIGNVIYILPFFDLSIKQIPPSKNILWR